MKALRPEAAEFWIDILDRAEPIARAIPRERACSYAPWTEALRQIASTSKYWTHEPVYELNLMGFAGCVSLPVWPEERFHLIDFTIRFLKADVMLFRSGYTKKLLLRRLKQVELGDSHSKQVYTLLKRSVIDGAGLEEFREFCRLASRIVTDDLRSWLTNQSDGVFVSLEDSYGPGYFYWREKLGEDVFQKRGLAMFAGRPAYFFPADPPHTIVKVGDLPEGNRVKLNAWRMLKYIERTET